MAVSPDLRKCESFSSLLGGSYTYECVTFVSFRREFKSIIYLLFLIGEMNR